SSASRQPRTAAPPSSRRRARRARRLRARPSRSPRRSPSRSPSRSSSPSPTPSSRRRRRRSPTRRGSSTRATRRSSRSAASRAPARPRTRGARAASWTPRPAVGEDGPVWPDEVDDVLGGDLTCAIAYVTPAGGAVVTAVAPIGLRDREANTVGFTTSLGFGRKLDRLRTEPRIAMAYHAREHGVGDGANRRY